MVDAFTGRVIKVSRIGEGSKEIDEVIKDLERNGIFIEGIRHRTGMFNVDEYQKGIPILIKWLDKLHYNNSFMWLLSILSAKFAGQQAVSALIQLFKSDIEPSRLKWTIADALFSSAGKEHENEIIELVKEDKYGHNRQMLILLLGKLKSKKSVPVLLSLLEDDHVNGHSIEALGKIGASEAKKEIVKFLNHSMTWKRNAAKTAIKRIERAEEKRRIAEEKKKKK